MLHPVSKHDQTDDASAPHPGGYLSFLRAGGEEVEGPTPGACIDCKEKAMATRTNDKKSIWRELMVRAAGSAFGRAVWEGWKWVMGWD